MSIKKNKILLDLKLVNVFGLDIALLVQTFIRHQKKCPDFVDDAGNGWLSKKSKEWIKIEFPFWERGHIRSLFEKIKQLGVLKIQEINKRKINYCIDIDKISERVRTHAQSSNIYNNNITGNIDTTTTSIYENTSSSSSITNKTSSILLDNSNTRSDKLSIDQEKDLALELQKIYDDLKKQGIGKWLDINKIFHGIVLSN